MVGPIRESVETLELTKRVTLMSTADLIGSIDAVVGQISAQLAVLDSEIAHRIELVMLTAGGRLKRDVQEFAHTVEGALEAELIRHESALE